MQVLVEDGLKSWLLKKSKYQTPRKRALVICTHLRRERIKRKSSHFLQPISGLHIASLIEPNVFEVSLYHEDWHGPFDVLKDKRKFDIVFLTGLQADFDRMRQLSYHFQRNGAKVVAGGSICTLFPEFASQFFNAVCAGGVDSIRDVIQDFHAGALKPVYKSTSYHISHYDLDYTIFSRAGISPPSHLIEASRGCSFRCSFCVLPAEDARHASYDIQTLRHAIDNAIKASPVFSLRRWYPTVFFLDNNFTDNIARALEVANLLNGDHRIRGWGALVTQNILHDRDLVLKLFESKCRMLFIGLESLDREFLRRYNKKQNLSRRDIVSDILYAESLGICVGYGYLLDPRTASAAEMKEQIAALAATPGFPMPTFLSLISPLLGTAAFWESARNGDLAPNLLLRDLDGETVAFSKLRDSKDALTHFVGMLARRPWMLVKRGDVIRSILKRIRASNRFNPLRWYMVIRGSLYPYAFGRRSKSPRTSFFAGEDPLDPQYYEYPFDISEADWEKYFKPIGVTRADGQLCDWLLPYAAKQGSNLPNAGITLA